MITAGTMLECTYALALGNECLVVIEIVWDLSMCQVVQQVVGLVELQGL